MASSAAEDPAASLAERVARRERAVVLASIGSLALLAWAWLAAGAGMAMAAGAMAPPSVPVVVLMWWTMMVAMMLPSAAPAILLYARVRSQQRGDAAIAPTELFMLGYLLAWLGFSLAAAAAQQALIGSGLVDPMALQVRAPLLAASALIAAGAYQLSPWKGACLSHCRSPAGFISRHFRPGAWGGLRLGLMHGVVCVGCCWLLMILLFVGGVMNLAWVAALAALVAVEKIAPRGDLLGRVAGAVMIAAGVALIVA